MKPSAGALVRAWTPAIFYMAFIWWMSSNATPHLDVARFPFADKGAHAAEYALLGFLLAHASRRSFPRHSALRSCAFGFVMAFAWGVLDELHQAFVPMRSADVLDVVADMVGALAGACARWSMTRAGGARRSSHVDPTSV